MFEIHMKFRIFTYKTGFKITINKIIYTILFASLGVAYLGSKLFEDDNIVENIGKIGVYLGCILMIFFKMTQNFIREPLNGILNGELQFFENEILINKNIYSLSEIKKIEFYVSDYFNEWKFRGKGDFNPSKSNGTCNICKITLNNGDKIAINFQLMYNREFLKMRELLIKYHSENKIHFLKLIEYLRIDDYEDIQEFKKTLPVTSA